jgi:hypothetical protein
MYKRFSTAALAAAFVVLAVPADARKANTNSDMYDSADSWQDDGDDNVRASRRVRAIDRNRRIDGAVWQWQHGDTDAAPRQRQHRAAKRSRRTRAASSGGDLRARRFYSGGASASRACLTPAARALLGRIEAQFGRVQIVSTCRPGARIAGTGRRSKHATGEAIDFKAPGKKAAVVRWLIANHKSGGTMTYSDMSHIHVDIGHRFVSLNH